MTGRQQRDPWPWALFALHLVQALALVRLFPHTIYDPDLVAYFIYFRNLVLHDTVLHGIGYFTVPKPLLVFALGPLGSAWLAFACTAVASAALGSVAYLIGRGLGGRPLGVLLSLLLLLDAQKATLTLRSSADLYVALFLLATIHFSTVNRLGLASACLFLSALVKPVTLPCALHFLAVDDGQRRRRWLCALAPLGAIPIVLASNYLLVGTATAPERFFTGFDAMSEGTPIGPGEVLHFVVWTQLVKHTFVSTAPWGFLGLMMWLARDKRRLTTPILLVPVLFLLGYLLLSAGSPYVPFYRFFWPVEVWFLAFVLDGMLATVRALAGGERGLRVAAGVALVAFLANDYALRFLSYRERFAVPFENAMAFVSTTPETLRRERRDPETILCPLAFLPYLMWALDVHARTDLVLTAEQVAVEGRVPQPDWILAVPEIYTNRSARDLVARLVNEGGYEVRLTDGRAALLARPSPERDIRTSRRPAVP